MRREFVEVRELAMLMFEPSIAAYCHAALLAVLLLLLSTGRAAVRGAGDTWVNLLYNGSFEIADPYLGSPDGWLHPLGQSAALAGAPDGDRACLLDVDTTAPAVLAQEAAIDGSRVRTVRLSGYGLVIDDGGDALRIGLRWHRYNRHGKGGRTETAQALTLSETDGQWRRVEKAFPVPEWAEAAIVVIGFRHGKGTAWLDDIRLDVAPAALARHAAIPNRGNLWDDSRVPARERVKLDPDLPRPSLLFRRADVPRVRERIEHLPWAARIFERYRQQAEEALSRSLEIPAHSSCEGDLDMSAEKERLSRPHRELLSALYALSVVYGITGDTRYAEKGKEILVGYARQYGSYPLAGYEGDDGDDSSRLTRQVLTESMRFVDFAIEYDLLYEALTAQERVICAAFLRHGAHVILANHRAEGNHGCWRNAGIGLIGLALRDERLVNAELFGRWGSMHHMQWDVVDGFWYEGSMGYELFALRAMTALTEAAHNCGINVYRDNQTYKSLFDNLAANVGPDGVYPPFNDNNYVHMQSQLFDVAYARWSDANYLAALNGVERDDLTAVLVGADAVGPAPPSVPGAVWYEAGQAVLRAGSGRDAAFLAVDFGPHAGFHSHYDCLAFYYYNRRTVLTVDPAAHSLMYLAPMFDGWARTTFAHATVSVDYRNQAPGAGRCEFMEPAPFVRAVGVGTDSTYEGILHRRALLLVGTEYLLCLDRLESGSEHVYDWNYHGPGPVHTTLPMAAAEPENGPGYANLQSPKMALPLDPWQAAWRTGAVTLTVVTDVQSGDEVRTGDAPHYLRSIESGALTLRRRGETVEFAVALEANSADSDSDRPALQRTDLVGAHARGTRLTLSSGGLTDTLLLRWEGDGSMEQPDVTLDGRYAWARQSRGQLLDLVLGQGREARLGGAGLRLRRAGTCELESIGDGRYRVTWHGDGENTVEIAGLELRTDAALNAASLDSGGRPMEEQPVAREGDVIRLSLARGRPIVVWQ